MLGDIYTRAWWIDPKGDHHEVAAFGHDDFVREHFDTADPTMEALRDGWIKVQETPGEIIVMVFPETPPQVARRVAAP